MKADFETYYVKAPLGELAKLAAQLIRCQIPCEFDGTIRMKIEVCPVWEKAVSLKLAGMRRRCERNRQVFGLEHYPTNISNQQP